MLHSAVQKLAVFNLQVTLSIWVRMRTAAMFISTEKLSPPLRPWKPMAVETHGNPWPILVSLVVVAAEAPAATVGCHMHVSGRSSKHNHPPLHVLQWPPHEQLRTLPAPPAHVCAQNGSFSASCEN